MTQPEWTEALREFIAVRRAAVPEDEAALGVRDTQEYRVEGGFLTQWLETYGPGFLRERSFFRMWPSDPVIVLHGDLPMLSACATLLGADGIAGKGRVIAMLDSEYQAFLRAHREPEEFHYHVSSWSYFRDADVDMLETWRRMGREVDSAHAHRNHVTGTLWGPSCGLQSENLWSWDGEKLTLVEEAIRSIRY